MSHQPMPIEAQILPQIQQAAEKHQLGTPLAIYKKRGTKSAGKAALKALTLGLAILILPQIFLLGLELSVDGTWIWIIGILLTLSLLIGVSSYRSAMRHRFDQVVMYAEGFVYLNGSLLPVTRWEQIAKVWRGTKVHPEGGEAGLGDVDILRLQKFDACPCCPGGDGIEKQGGMFGYEGRAEPANHEFTTLFFGCCAVAAKARASCFLVVLPKRYCPPAPLLPALGLSE